MGGKGDLVFCGVGGEEGREKMKLKRYYRLNQMLIEILYLSLSLSLPSKY